MRRLSTASFTVPMRDRAGIAVAWSERRVRPAHGVIAVSVVAGLALAASQLLDYRGVRIGALAYAEVETVAPAPEVDRERASAAHGGALYPVALAALAITVLATRGRWRLARLLVPLGLAAVAISLTIDLPRGLDEQRAALAYEGAEAVLLEGFWAQLAAGATLACCGPLLAVHLGASARAGRRPGRRRRSARTRSAGAPPSGARSHSARPPGACFSLCATSAPGGGGPG
jgi:hypothetical protein